MITKSNQEESLIKEAKIEERNYNWEKAADLYEQAAKIYLEREKLKDAANIYIKLGDICIRAIYASEIKECYLNWNKQAFKAFRKAESLFIQTNDKLLSDECEARALSVTGFVITSVEEARKNIKKSVDILLKLIEEYSKVNDTKNWIRLITLIIGSINLYVFITSDPSELEYYSQLGRNLIEKAWTRLKEIDTIEIRSSLLFGESILILNINRWTELTYGDKKQEKVNKKFLKRCEETLNLVQNSDEEINHSYLGDIYGTTGFVYCIFGSLLVEEKKERVKLAEKGFELLEKSVAFFKNSRNILGAISYIYSTDYHAGL
ncbi:MAG: hypothetical protein ACFFBK_10160, partial [Promethearchaeota archaeon]